MEQEVLEKILDDAWSSFKLHLLQSIAVSHSMQTPPMKGPTGRTYSISECGTGECMSREWSRGVSPDMYMIEGNDSIHPLDGTDSKDAPEMLRRITSFSQGTGSAQLEKVAYLRTRIGEGGKEHSRAIRRRLRLRLGTISTTKCVSGTSLHQAVLALGLTRYKLEEVNTIVNDLASFIHLAFEKEDCEPTWHWPKLKDQHLSLSSASWENLRSSNHSVVPVKALMEILLAQDGEVHKRIFGPSLPAFQAIREVLLAGDTNRLVAELTFVRLNDLAAPPEPVPPMLFIEMIVACVVISNAIMMGLQMDPEYHHWEGWFWMELCFTSLLLLEVCIRLRILGCQNFFCGLQAAWSFFDLFLLGCALVDVTKEVLTQEHQDLSGSSLLRLCRLVRLVRIVKAFRLKFMGELRLMVKGLIAGIRTLTLAFILLFTVLYVIGGFATLCIGDDPKTHELGLKTYFRTLPDSMYTAFRCFTGECVNEFGQPLHYLLAAQFGLPFIFGYVMSYMLVTMGICNVILAVYVDITMKAAKENEALTAEQHSRESIRIARVTRELLKKFAAAYGAFQEDMMDESTPPLYQRLDTSMFTDDQIQENIAITKELFLLVIQDRRVQALMDDLELPRDRANLFEIIDADGSGTLQVVELVQGLLKIRGEVSKSDTVASYLATKSLQDTVNDMKVDFSRQLAELRTELQERNRYLEGQGTPTHRDRASSKISNESPRNQTSSRGMCSVASKCSSRLSRSEPPKKRLQLERKSSDLMDKSLNSSTGLEPFLAEEAPLDHISVISDHLDETPPNSNGSDGSGLRNQLKLPIKPEISEEIDAGPPQPFCLS
ncbi:unnamed protein product [Durusdinium trenchii]|uniref:L type n=2 Tax=Durusdinium trenchii TaxID=1381693 RepID=A0ABP0NHF2_9DINO